jgi:hypothetical protein
MDRTDSIRVLDAELLAELESVLAQQPGRLLSRTPSGLEADEIVAAFDREGATLSREAALWWGWRDGSSLQILPGLEHIPLASAFQGRRILRELAADVAAKPPETDPDAWWNPGWIPIFGTGGLPKIALDCSGARDAPSPVRQIDWDGFGASHYARAFARSLGEYVASAVRCLSGGRYTYDAERDVWLPMDWANTSAGERF